MENKINTTNNNINFGNLYIRKGIFRFNKTYKFNNKAFSMVKVPIEELAKDVDIFVRYRNFGTKGFDIKVGKATKSLKERFFQNYSKETLRPDDLYFSKDCLPDLLLDKTKRAKDYFLNFKNYLTND